MDRFFPWQALGAAVESVAYSCRPEPDLTLKRLDAIGAEGGLSDTSPALTGLKIEEYHSVN